MANGDDTRARIEEAALGLFLERGYVGTPLRLIAQEAQVTTPALYWYFKSKDELCGAAMLRAYRSFEDHLQEAAGADGTPEQRLRGYVRAFVMIQLEDRGRPVKVAFHQVAASLPDEQRAQLARIQRPVLDRLREILRAGDADGSFAVLDVTTTAFAIISIANYVFTWQRPAGLPGAEAIAELYAELAVRLATGRAHAQGSVLAGAL